MAKQIVVGLPTTPDDNIVLQTKTVWTHEKLVNVLKEDGVVIDSDSVESRTDWYDNLMQTGYLLNLALFTKPMYTVEV